jgi:hemerythrin superfamily protein
MTIFDALKKDHDELKLLLAKIDSKKDAPDFTEQFDKLRALVVVHSRAEEDTFYAELEEFDEIEERAERATEEHQEVEALLNELGAGDLGSAEWRQTFAEMREALLRHIRDEESELFKEAASVLQETDLERMARAFAAERDRLINEEAPGLSQKRA